jgi:MFS family permease
MKTRPLATAMAIGAGVIVLVGYFVPGFGFIRVTMIQWAAIAGGAAVLVGIANLFTVHFKRVSRREKDYFYSLLLLLAMLGTFLASLVFKPTHPIIQKTVVEGIITPVESSLMALLAVSLVYASIRLLRRRVDWMSILFLLTTIGFLAASVVLPLILPSFGDAIVSWVSLYLAGGGARGLLIGVALGVLTTGLRLITGADRPYGGK